MFGYVDMRDAFRIHTLYTAFEHTYQADYSYPGEQHNFWELVLVIDGQIGVTAGRNIYMLKKGQAIIHHPMEFHRLWSEGNSCPHLAIFSFGAENFPNYSSNIFQLADSEVPGKILQQMHDAYIFDTFDKISIVGIQEGAAIQSQSILKALEQFVLNTVALHARKPAERSSTARNYASIIKTLEHNIDKNLSVADIAQLCNTSQISLKKTFSRYTGFGVIHYFNRMKINAAITMLQSGSSVKETANELGFSSQNYFSTVFKRITGHSPRNYTKGLG